MFIAMNESQIRICSEDATKNEHYYCPVCNGGVRLKKGTVNAPHFAHISIQDCDDFTADMSEWHKEWQNCFPIKNREVVITHKNEKHRADVLCYGVVVEFQHSPISEQEFRRRNEFYTLAGYEVVWVFDVIELYQQGEGRIKQEDNILAKGYKEFSWNYPWRMLSSFDPQEAKNVHIFFHTANSKESKCLEHVTWADLYTGTPWKEFRTSSNSFSASEIKDWIKRRWMQKKEKISNTINVLQNWFSISTGTLEVKIIERSNWTSFLLQAPNTIISYHYDTNSLYEDIEFLDDSNNSQVIYIFDEENCNIHKTHRKKLLELQEVLGYCLLIGKKNNRFTMRTVSYQKNYYNAWEELELANGPLYDYAIFNRGELRFRGTPLNKLLEEKTADHAQKVQEHKRKLQEQERLTKEFREKKAREEQLKKEQREKLLAEMLQRKKEEAERLQAEKNRREAERQAKKQKLEEDFQKNLKDNFTQQQTPVIDGSGRRWVKCERCGFIAGTSEFTTYGGTNHINLGICKRCFRGNQNQSK